MTHRKAWCWQILSEFKEPSKELCPISELIYFLEKQLTEPKLKDDVFAAAKEQFKCRDRNLKDRINKIMDEAHVLYNKNGLEALLYRGKQGEQASFELKPIKEMKTNLCSTLTNV